MEELNRFSQFTSMIAVISREITRIEREQMDHYGLKGAYAQYLLALRQFPQGVTAAALCEICDKDKAAVSRVIADLEQNELLTRVGVSGYRASLRLTEKGQATADYVCRKAEMAVSAAGSVLQEEEREIMYAALRKIADSLRQIDYDSLPDA